MDSTRNNDHTNYLIGLLDLLWNKKTLSKLGIRKIWSCYLLWTRLLFWCLLFFHWNFGFSQCDRHSIELYPVFKKDYGLHVITPTKTSEGHHFIAYYNLSSILSKKKLW